MPSKKQPVGYPYIANSVPHIKEQMLREVGAESISELYEEIPERLRLHRKIFRRYSGQEVGDEMNRPRHPRHANLATFRESALSHSRTLATPFAA